MKQDVSRKETQIESKPAEKKVLPLVTFAPFLLAGIICLFGYFLMMSHDPFSKNPDEDKEKKVQFHLFQTGTRLNRDRIQVEYENALKAPPLKPQEKPVVQPDMMRGVPLVGEGHHRRSSRDRLRPVDADYPDAKAAYSLQEEQEARAFEAQAYQEYVREFVENAAKAGYKVEVDKNGNANVTGRIPANRRKNPSFQYDDDFDSHPSANR